MWDGAAALKLFCHSSSYYGMSEGGDSGWYRGWVQGGRGGGFRGAQGVNSGGGQRIYVMYICEIYHDDDAAAAVEVEMVAAIVEKVEKFGA